MSLSDVIASFGGPLTIRRTVTGAYVNGRYVPDPSPTTVTIIGVVQNAYNISRVVGGADMHARVDLQETPDVRQLHTATKLFARSPGTDPDVLTGFEGADWTVDRVEEYNLAGDIHYRCVITKQTGGAS